MFYQNVHSILGLLWNRRRTLWANYCCSPGYSSDNRITVYSIL
uniref:Uncharacterized protein n=1 Tax=Setaria italica TaxID=4555 RepID=K3XUB0_SETIT